jgi:hypothetical protein
MEHRLRCRRNLKLKNLKLRKIIHYLDGILAGSTKNELTCLQILKLETLNQDYTVFPIHFKFFTISFTANRTCTSITAITYFDFHNSCTGTIQSKNISATVMLSQSETIRNEVCVQLSLMSNLLMIQVTKLQLYNIMVTNFVLCDPSTKTVKYCEVYKTA